MDDNPPDNVARLIRDSRDLAEEAKCLTEDAHLGKSLTKQSIDDAIKAIDESRKLLDLIEKRLNARRVGAT